MTDLTTTYLGLKLKNPFIVGSSGLTDNIDSIKKLEAAGAGAIVLKSIFEEQINHEADAFMKSDDEKMSPMKKGFADIMKTRSQDYEEAMQYMNNFAKEHTLVDYLNFITEVKKAVKIPVIASVNCVASYDWHFFARRIQQAGADALELNIYVLPSDPDKNGAANEQLYFSILEEVKKYVTIPVSLKVGYYFSGLASTLIALSKTGIKGMVLFNRPYSPDIDIDNFKITAGNIYSTPGEFTHTLRWMAILSGKIGCDLVASTGIHTAESAIKQILAGATAVQVTSALYKNGPEHLTTMIEGLRFWMTKHNFNSLADFKGKLSQASLEHPAAYERVQFMKMYSKIL